MRVVSGSARGRTLIAPRGDAVRPTTDRVRESLFNALGSLDLVVGARFVDLFAGSGALGIEALSRGAAEVTFVDEDRRALAAVRANLDSSGLAGPAATVVSGDALAWAAGYQGPPFDVALADPPYRFADWDRLLAVVPAPFVAAESDRVVVAPPGWALVRSRAYGTTVVTFLRRPALDKAAPDDTALDDTALEE